jgi:hypothetical protein
MISSGGWTLTLARFFLYLSDSEDDEDDELDEDELELDEDDDDDVEPRRLYLRDLDLRLSREL